MTKNILLTQIMENDVNNEEIRYQLLKTLYDRHYNVKPDTPVATEEVIKEAGLENEEKNVVDANIVYLKEGYYAEGLGNQPRSAVPLMLQINPSGIEFVEERNKDYREYHDNLRFKILSKLYEFQFGGNTGKYASTVDLVDEITEKDDEKHHLLVETLYLGKSGYIKPHQTSGVFYPRAMMIENYGIDLVDGIIDQSVQELESADIDLEDKSKLTEIKSAPDKKTKFEKFKELLPETSEVTKPIIIETIKQAIIRAFSGEFGGELSGGA